ncbi:porin [Candidatus Odyssella acanthamoebae]|uniref:Uncharacterized protein n=1 Tax=Candidatus Odyssella acanthamoebae TaxID=91604 RepID=A0A077AS47_9PROT|nr:porin [Candidatus Paracaedibacter acanthamoebae]AIK95992.1 hypothetical protein ID47_03410 [Candidatus Paracaedibacter acanthamoebae]
MNNFIKYFLVTVTVCIPFSAEAKKCKKKVKCAPHQAKIVKPKRDAAPNYSPDYRTQTRLAKLETKIKKLEESALREPKPALVPEKLPKSLVTSGNPKSSVKLSGQINRFVAYRNNGNQSRIEHLDSTASSSRVNITGQSNINSKFQIQAVIETELTDGVQSAAADADIGSAPIGSAYGDTSPIVRNRRLEAVFKHDTFGTLFIGKGSTSSDGVSEVDFSGTTAISNASEASNNLGGFRFYNKKLRTSANQRIASDAFRNMDGLQRANRIRYDSPSFKGVVIGLTHTNGDQSDQSIKYAAKFGKTKVGAAIAHTYQPFSTVTVNNATQSRCHHTYHGSFAIYNNGFSFGAAGGIEKYRMKSAVKQLKRKQATFWFLKAGYQTKFINCGKTAFAIDWGYSKANTLLETNLNLANNERAKSYALTIVQNFDSAGTEVYFSAREYHFEQPFASYKNAVVVLVGTRVKF